MPFSIAWDDAGRTSLLVIVEGEWSIDELMRTLTSVVAYLHKVSHPVIIIVDARKSAAPPLGIIWHSRVIYKRLPGNYAGGVVVTSDNLWRNVVMTVRTLYVKTNNPLVAVRTLEEARATVQKWRVEGTF